MYTLTLAIAFTSFILSPFVSEPKAMLPGVALQKFALSSKSTSVVTDRLNGPFMPGLKVLGIMM